MKKKFFKNECVIITGGSSGIGLEIVNFFIKKKFIVLNIDKKKK